MKVILFDLGNTLENTQVGGLLPGALKTLKAIQEMKSADGNPAVLALVSDFGDIPATPAQIDASLQEYLEIIDNLGIRKFFEPVSKRITLSTQAGATKPSKVIFGSAVKKISSQLKFGDVMFITENKSHVTAARSLGMKAVHFKGPGETNGDVKKLSDVIPIVRQFVK
jgi:FMN phosphatase YigB (HAD superfamily)